METAPSERLANLFVSDQFLAKNQAQQQLSLLDSGGEDGRPAATEASGVAAAKWEIPATAKAPRKVHGPQPRPAAGRDQLTSSDEDDEDEYVAAFQAKARAAATSARSAKRRSRIEPLFGAPGHETLASSPSLAAIDGQGNPALGHFCRFSLAAKFPYKYMDDKDGQVSRRFFANQKFYQRPWDLYYIHQPYSSASSQQPILLLPYHQVKALIEDISTACEIEVAVPAAPFTMSFFDDGTPQPAFLGRTNCRADINDLQDSIRAPDEAYGEPPAGASEGLRQAFAAFKAKVDRVPTSRRGNKSSNKKEKKKGTENDRFLLAQDLPKQLRRAQRYFGLRPEPYRQQQPPPGMPWEEQSVFIQAEEKNAGVALERLDVTKPAPHECLAQPVIVAIDVESYERAHELVTEVGVSTLDTLDLAGREPGTNGELWMQHIRSRHFRIKGKEIYVNKDFCIGDGNAFDFGQSEWVALDKIGDAIDSCFEWPFSGPESSNRGGPARASERTMLLVGHALHGDLKYLSKLNSAVFSAPREPGTTTTQLSSQAQLRASSAGAAEPDARALKGAQVCDRIAECLDTSQLYKALMHDGRTPSLVSIMAEIERPTLHPHNSGNDARYTLEALIGLVIKARLLDDEAEAQSGKW